MEAISMQDLYSSNGKINWFGWIFFLATLFLIGYSIYQQYLSVKKLQTDETEQQKKIMELEFNIKALRGDQYQKL